MFNVVDDFTRECVLQISDFLISGQRLANELDRIAIMQRLPKTIVCDNGPELTSKVMFLWSQRERSHGPWPTTRGGCASPKGHLPRAQ